MSVRVRRMMQKIVIPKDTPMLKSIRAPGLRLTFDNPTKPGGSEFEISVMEAQVLATVLLVDFVDDAFMKVIEVDVALPTDEVISEPAPADG